MHPATRMSHDELVLSSIFSYSHPESRLFPDTVHPDRLASIINFDTWIKALLFHLFLFQCLLMINNDEYSNHLEYSILQLQNNCNEIEF